jgi:hypothetical protein
LILQTIDEDEEFTPEELAKFEEDYEAARRQVGSNSAKINAIKIHFKSLYD